MKKLFQIVALVSFVASTSMAVVHAAKGNTEQVSNDLAGSAVALFAAGFVAAPKTSYNLGLQMNRTEETLLEWLASSNRDSQALQNFKSGRLRFRDYNFYRSIQIDSFSGIKAIWDRTVSKATGVTNVDRATLDKDVHFCVDRILIQYGNSGGAGTDPTAISSYDGVVTGWPAGLINAEVHIYQDSNPLMENHPACLCGSQGDATSAIGFADAYRLTTPFVIEGDKPFEVRIDFPQSIAATNTDFLKFIMLGVGTRKRGQI